MNPYRLPEHPLRGALLAEVHARPIVISRTPQHLTHLALHVDRGEHERELAHIVALCHEMAIDPPQSMTNHALLETADFRLRWERHMEFSTYTFFSRSQDTRPFQSIGLGAVPAHWLEKLPGALLVACHLSVVRADVVAENPERLAEFFDLQSLVGSSCAGGAATAWTDFQPQVDGFTRFLVLDKCLRPAQAGRLIGRLIQNLLEIETYRLMALLAFPIVRDLMPEIIRMEDSLGDLTEIMAQGRDPEQEQMLLESLSTLSAQVERLTAQHHFRLRAATDYSVLVRRRIDALRESRVEGFNTLYEFIERRLVPAMNTCQVFAERLDRLSRRVGRAVDLLRSRVDLALETQNNNLLESMNRRTRLQLRLQATVEGLSVVILSYYIVGLLHHALAGLEAAGLHFSVELLTGLSIPFVIAGVGVGIYAVHRWVERADAAQEKSGTDHGRDQV